MSRREHGEGSISSYQLTSGKTRYVVRWREPRDPTRPELGNERHSKAGFVDREEARDFLHERIVGAKRGIRHLPDGGRWRFDSYARRWLDGYDCEDPTREYIIRVLDAVQPTIGDVPINQILPSDLARCYRALERGGGPPHPSGRPRQPLASSTVARYAGWLVTIFNVAIEDGLIQQNPASHKRSGRPRGAKARRVKPFTIWEEAQALRFVAWAQDRKKPWALAWELMIHTGIRSGELLALQWRDVDLAAGAMNIERSLRYNASLPKGKRYEIGPVKGHKPRRIKLGAKGAQVLRKVRAEKGDNVVMLRRANQPVFPSRPGRSATQSGLLSAFWRAQAEYDKEFPDAGLPTINVHDLRHTHASVLLAAGVDIKVIQKRLGHASSQVTLQTYLHLMPDAEEKALGLFEEHLDRALEEAQRAEDAEAGLLDQEEGTPEP